MRALFSQLLDLLYPPKCVFCRRLLRPEEHDVCARCAHELEPIPAPLRRGQFYTECYAVYPYEGVVAESLRRFKFSGQSQYAASFGRMLAPLLRTAPFEILSWVPVSAKRRRSRGYDQTELLAHAVAKELELPCTQTLQKIRHNPAQSSQRDAAARRANVLGAYRAVSPERFAGRSVLLIDDILTTGATLSECSREQQLAPQHAPVRPGRRLQNGNARLLLHGKHGGQRDRQEEEQLRKVQQVLLHTKVA